MSGDPRHTGLPDVPLDHRHTWALHALRAAYAATPAHSAWARTRADMVESYHALLEEPEERELLAELADGMTDNLSTERDMEAAQRFLAAHPRRTTCGALQSGGPCPMPPAHPGPCYTMDGRSPEGYPHA